MFDLSTKQIAKELNGQVLNFDFNKNAFINSIVSNHVQVKKNSIFVAIKGENFDGHNFIKQAFNKGCCLAIVEKQIPNLPQIVVKNTRHALLKLAKLNRLQFHGPVIAVTGSFGKTTTKDLIAEILSTKKQVLKTQENLNNEIGVSQTLLNLSSSHTAAVVELGMSHANEISQLSKAVQPTTGIITGIGSAHLENFKNKNEILKAKLEILDGMTKTSSFIFNADDEKLNAALFKPHPSISCSIKNPKSTFFANKIDVNYNSNTTTFTTTYNKKTTTFKLPLIGEFNVLNALLAIAVGSIHEIEFEKMKQKLQFFKPSGLRQKLIQINSINVIADCYNASPETVKAALISFSKMQCTGKKFAVLGDMLELGEISEIAHKKIGHLLDQLKIDEIIGLGELAKLICSNTKKEAHHFNSTNQLISFVKNKLKPNDLILFKASHGMNFENLINKIFSNILNNQ